MVRDSHGARIIPEIPGLSAVRLCRHPLMAYSIFVSVSLALLGGIAVASLPM